MIEIHSDTWREVSRRAGEARAEALALLVQPGLPATDTEFQRGRIAALDAVLALAEPRAKPSFPQESFVP